MARYVYATHSDKLFQRVRGKSIGGSARRQRRDLRTRLLHTRLGVHDQKRRSGRKPRAVK